MSYLTLWDNNILRPLWISRLYVGLHHYHNSGVPSPRFVSNNSCDLITNCEMLQLLWSKIHAVCNFFKVQPHFKLCCDNASTLKCFVCAMLLSLAWRPAVVDTFLCAPSLLCPLRFSIKSRACLMNLCLIFIVISP